MKVSEKAVLKNFHFLLWRIIRRGGYIKVSMKYCI